MAKKRSYKDRAEYLIKAVAKRRKKLREDLVAYNGGKCCICGYDKYIGALEFHHIFEDDKNFGLSSRGLTRSWEKMKTEADKCILVCSNCHKEIHANITQPPIEILE